jgi:hypothetical protein
MNMRFTTLLVASLTFLSLASFADEASKNLRKVADHLQDISVTIKAESPSGYGSSEGSGTMIVREVNGEKITFVWTAGHVIDHLRNVRTVINESGQPVKVVEFADPTIVKELVEKGRRVGEMKMDARVIKFSDADDGEDLAVLMVRARDYAKSGAEFRLEKEDDNIVPIGTQLFHVGSLLGQMGANSMTTGIISQVGRTLGKVEYDQTTVTAFPGSSGGGVYLTDGRYVGMLVRGAGEGFNLIVPVRRMERWAKKHNIMWALDSKVKMPSFDEIDELPVEAAGLPTKSKKTKSDKEKTALKDMPFLIKVIPAEGSSDLETELDKRPTGQTLSPKLELR